MKIEKINLIIGGIISVTMMYGIFIGVIFLKTNVKEVQTDSTNKYQSISKERFDSSPTQSKTQKTKISLSSLKDILNLKDDKEDKDTIRIVQFDPSNVRVLSGITYEEMTEILKDTQLVEVSKAFVDAEQKYKVNAIFLAGIAALESHWGDSDRAITQNNLMGMNVTSDDAAGNTYDTPYDCIMDTARQLDTYYLTENAKYYKGLSVGDVNFFYCVKSSWTNSVTEIGHELMDKYYKAYNITLKN